MNYYLAPMDNVTDYIYRQVVWRHFPYWDKVYAPFIQPNEKPTIVPKEDFDICPENNGGIPMIPQILTCDSEGFIRVGKILEDYGYDEINLNLGCPAKPIVAKGKGSGMLADTDKLKRFFDEIFKHDWHSKITVKTRLGLTDNSDFEDLLCIFSDYPIEELTIHPRYRSDFYSGVPRLAEFEKVFSFFKNIDKIPFKVCYNGNIFSADDAVEIMKKYPHINSIMCGRGAISDPSLGRQLKGGTPITPKEFKAFHDDIFSSYKNVIPREKHLLQKMMEMWTYWSKIIPCDEESFKHLRLSANISEYLDNVKRL